MSITTIYRVRYEMPCDAEDYPDFDQRLLGSTSDALRCETCNYDTAPVVEVDYKRESQAELCLTELQDLATDARRWQQLQAVHRLTHPEFGEAEMTVEEILDEINRDRSDSWEDYDETDWQEGLREWTEWEVIDG